jgi:hypothetical protein
MSEEQLRAQVRAIRRRIDAGESQMAACAAEEMPARSYRQYLRDGLGEESFGTTRRRTETRAKEPERNAAIVRACREKPLGTAAEFSDRVEWRGFKRPSESTVNDALEAEALDVEERAALHVLLRTEAARRFAMSALEQACAEGLLDEALPVARTYMARAVENAKAEAEALRGRIRNEPPQDRPPSYWSVLVDWRFP